MIVNIGIRAGVWNHHNHVPRAATQNMCKRLQFDEAPGVQATCHMLHFTCKMLHAFEYVNKQNQHCAQINSNNRTGC